MELNKDQAIKLLEQGHILERTVGIGTGPRGEDVELPPRYKFRSPFYQNVNLLAAYELIQDKVVAEVGSEPYVTYWKLTDLVEAEKNEIVVTRTFTVKARVKAKSVDGLEGQALLALKNLDENILENIKGIEGVYFIDKGEGKTEIIRPENE